MALVRIVLVAVTACLSIAAFAQEPSRAPVRDAADPGSAVAPVVYSSPFSGYRRYADGEVEPWRAVNDEVARIGGWKVYAREVYEAAEAEKRKAHDPGPPSAAPAAAGTGSTGK